MKSIKKFNEVYSSGAFSSNPREAMYCYRNLIGNSVKKRDLLKISSQAPTISADKAVALLTELILCMLDDMRKDVKLRGKLSQALREALGPIDCYLTNIVSGNFGLGTRRFKFYVSRGVIDLLRLNKCPEVTLEHKVPIRVLRDEMMKTCNTEDEVFSYLKAHFMTAFVTKDEDKKLSELGFRETVPIDEDRYSKAGINIICEPIYFRRGHANMKKVMKNSPSFKY